MSHAHRWEQRHWCVTTFMETLLAAKHPFADGILAEFEELQPSPPSDLSGYRRGNAGDVFQCGSMRIGFDGAGAIGACGYNLPCMRASICR